VLDSRSLHGVKLRDLRYRLMALMRRRGWRERMAREAMQLACLFQHLGYFGRCSFDAVLSGEDFDRAQLHWIECNGCWGGTSIPMTLCNRLVGDWSTRSLMVIQRAQIPSAPRKFDQALDSIGALLFRRGRDEARVVVLTPGGLEHGTRLHFLLVGSDADEVSLQAQALQRLFSASA
jgi:hypothetical protein